MKIEEFLGRLEAVSQTGEGKWVARCPAHADGNPSLGVAVGDDGRILLHCYAGCSAEAIVSALGLKMKDLMPEGTCNGATRKKGVRKSANGDAVESKDGLIVKPLSEYQKAKRDYGKLVCAYDYQDESGAVVFRVERRVKADGKKTFVQMHPDPKSRYGWTWGVSSAGVTRVPFRLPRILAAGKAGKSVIVVEGEKDVLTVERTLGVAATCNPGGAGKWEVGWGKYFDGVSAVCIIADKDPLKKKNRKGEEETFAVGQRHACDVEAKLRADGYKGIVRKFYVPDVGDTKCKDYTDWVTAVEKAGGKVDKAAFQEAIRTFPGWPEEWEFGQAAEGDLTRAGKAARNTISDEPEEEAPGVDGKGCGRFGRLAPRTPSKGKRAYQVDFRVDRDRTIRFEVGVGHFRSTMWLMADGEYRVFKKNEPIELPLTAMYALAIGNCLDNAFNPGGRFGSTQQSELKSAITLLWLRSRGKFFWDENQKGFATSLYFDELTGVLMRVRSDEFAAFVATETEINREASGFKYLMSLIDDAAMSDKVAQGVTPSNMWDRKGDDVYISTGDDMMYRIRGGNVEKVQNGTDGVVFMRGKTLAPWVLSEKGVDPFDNALIFNGASWTDKNGRMNVRLWVLNLFACHATKPLLLITGAMQSGKTRMAKAVKEILGVRQDGRLDLSVQQAEDGDKGLDSFWATVNDGKLEVFDNLDTKIKWVSDTLQNVATDGQTKRRTLYTTFGVSILRANANIILTSNNPLFSTEGNGGMADRLISVHLETNRSVSMDTELSEDIRRNRDAYMTWIARTVASALADRGEVDASINRRHPDYGRFSVRCGRAFGNEQGVVEALGAAEADKSLLPLKNDVITKEMLLVLEDQDPQYSMRFTSGDMSDAILKRLGDDDTDEKTKMIYGSRRVGKAIAKYERQFAVIFKFTKRILEGKTLYEVSGLTAQGCLAMANSVGSVGLKSTFQNSTRINEGAGGFSENGVSNAPNPPHARALAGASPSIEEEEDSIKNETGGGDDDFVW